MASFNVELKFSIRVLLVLPLRANQTGEWPGICPNRPRAVESALAVYGESLTPMGKVSGHDFIDSATKYCQGAPSISAFFAEMGGNTMPLFSCRIKSRAAMLDNKRWALAPDECFFSAPDFHHNCYRSRAPAVSNCGSA
jgi:hypothetical protein